MFQRFSADIAECYARAQEAHNKAMADPMQMEFYLAMEQRWLSLARSYKFARQLGELIDEVRHVRNKFRK